MRNRTLYFLLAFSVALNLSFAGSFLYFGYMRGTLPGASRESGGVDLGSTRVEELDRLFLQSLQEKLALTREQMEQLSPVIHETHVQLHGIAKQLNEVGEQFYREARKPEVDEAPLEDVQVRWLELRNRQHQVLLKSLLRMRGLLTADQRDRYFRHLESSLRKNGIGKE